MEPLTILLLAVGLAMDALAVSMCKGLAMGRTGWGPAVAVGLWFGVFQALMPMTGFYLGRSFYDAISDYDHWVAAVLLSVIGLNMIRGSSGEDEGMDAGIGHGEMLVLAIATSVDALAVGISMAMGGGEVFAPAAVIGIVTFLISAAGVRVGAEFGNRYGSKAELAGGVILIVIGIEVLAEHLGYM